MSGKGLVAAAIVFLTCMTLLEFATGFLVDWFWFAAVGYRSVFWTIIGSQIG
jgi:uncharacterized membrane protein (UPF0182 family)